MSELGVLLKMLDQENLSSSTQEKKRLVWNLLQQMEPLGKRTDHVTAVCLTSDTCDSSPSASLQFQAETSST